MRVLTGLEEEEARRFLGEAGKVALNATCERAKCGTVIVKDCEVIGSGFNGPPAGDENQRRCFVEKDSYHKKVTDKTCCVHAEQRAIIDALKKNPEKIVGSRLYFARVDETGKVLECDAPYCTICSKMALDSGVTEFVLLHENGICVYDTKEYNRISFEFSR